MGCGAMGVERGKFGNESEETEFFLILFLPEFFPEHRSCYEIVTFPLACEVEPRPTSLLFAFINTAPIL